MPRKSQRPPSPITKAEPDPADWLAAALPPPLPDYEPMIVFVDGVPKMNHGGTEITASDLAKRNKWSHQRAKVWLDAQKEKGAWVVRVVRTARGHQAEAYRPVGK